MADTINKTDSDFNTESMEIEQIRQELESLRIQFAELESTNSHLIAATWRERDLKKKLTDTIHELNQTKQLVETQNKRITESINYARKIQLAINPTEMDLQASFPESFILYLPKDLISGDFPWLWKTGNYVYVAAVDCTGHGVPGAMMSMIGNLLLNDIANDARHLLPSEILRRLHISVVKTLKQDLNDSNSNDGMDMGLCRIDLKSKEVLYSGAHRPLFLLRNSIIETSSGDKFPIGGMHYKGLNCFTDHSIQFQAGDSVFLFTDGLPDQIGGDDKKKLMIRNLRSFFESNPVDDIKSYKTKLFDFYTEWKGPNKQIDDILVIGIKF